MLFGVKVRNGRLMKGTPIVTNQKVSLGKVISIQKNHKEFDEAKKREEVCIRIKNESNIQYGRQFTFADRLISEITRESIDELKENFREDMVKEDWLMVAEHMKTLGIKKSNA